MLPELMQVNICIQMAADGLKDGITQGNTSFSPLGASRQKVLSLEDPIQVCQFALLDASICLQGDDRSHPEGRALYQGVLLSL